MKPTSMSLKIAMFSIFAMAFLLITYYKAQMKAALSIQSFGLPINSWEDVLESNQKMFIVKGAFNEEYFKDAPEGSTLKKIYYKKIQNQPTDSIYTSGNEEPYLQQLKNGEAFEFIMLYYRSILPIFPCKITDVKALRYYRFFLKPDQLLVLKPFY